LWTQLPLLTKPFQTNIMLATADSSHLALMKRSRRKLRKGVLKNE
jgi:hypothetical protein